MPTPPAGQLIGRRTLLRAGALGTAVTATGGASALLTACGSPPDAASSDAPGPKDAKPSGQVRLLYQGDAKDKPLYDEMFKRFAAKYPDVKLEAVPDPSGTWDAFFANVQVKLAGGQKFDLIYIPTEGQRLFASKGLLQPVDAWIERDKAEIDEFAADADPNLLKWTRELSSPDGKTYFLPYVFNTMCLWYRPSLFKAAGVTEPSPAWTWDAFYEVAKKVTQPGKVYGFNAPVEYFAGIMPWLLTNGADVLSADWTKSTIATPEAIEAVTFARKLVTDGISPAPGGTFDQFAAAAKGQVAMFGAGRWPITTMRQSGIVDDLRILPWPRQKEQGSPVGWGSLALLKNSQNKDAAWAYIKFLLEKPTQDFIAKTAYSGAAPARRSSATGAEMLADSPKGTDEIYKALNYSTPVPGPDKSNRIQQSVQDTYKQILAGVSDPATALGTLDTQVQQAL